MNALLRRRKLLKVLVLNRGGAKNVSEVGESKRNRSSLLLRGRWHLQGDVVKAVGEAVQDLAAVAVAVVVVVVVMELATP